MRAPENATMTTAPEGWLTSTEGVPYPPEPWFLGGSLRVSAFRVPAGQLPAEMTASVPADHSPIRLGGGVTVGAAFVHYTAGGVLQYEELLVALAVHRGAQVRTSIPLIWVSSERSQRGGRELWAIPKHLGEFDRATSGPDTDTSMRWEGHRVASLSAGDGRSVLPGRRQLPLPTAQTLDGRRCTARNLAVGRVRRLHARWTFAPDGPLGFLAGRSPFGSAAITDAGILFGLEADRG